MKKITSLLLTLLLVFGLFTSPILAAQDTDFDKDLVVYLQEVSKERGFEVTREDLEQSLGLYDSTMTDFDTVDELKGFLGSVIKADLSNLNDIYELHELDKESVSTLLGDNGESIEDYIFVDDLDYALFFYNEGEFDEYDEYIDEDFFTDIMSELQISDEEVENIINHLMSLEEELSSPEVEAQIEALAERMMAFEDFDGVTELTGEQIAELLSIYKEALSILKLDASYSLVTDGRESNISLLELMNIKELKGANLKVALYTLDGQLLADLIVTGEDVDSEIINEVGSKIKDSKEVIKSVDHKRDYKTVKGGKLPSTGSNYLSNTFLGLLVALVGIVMYNKMRKSLLEK